MPQIHLKQPGQPVADFSFSGSVVAVAGVEIDCADRQGDTAVTVEIRANADGHGEGGSGAYLAQIAIPARLYIDMPGEDDKDGKPTIVRELVALDPNAVSVTLWPTA